MMPYYERNGIVIYHGDCRELLPLIDGDCLLTDPPYNVSNGIGAHHKRYLTMPFPMPEETYRQFCRDWFQPAEAKGIPMMFTPGIAHAWEYPQPKWVIAWHKPSAVGFNRMGGFNAWEPILVYGKPSGRVPLDHFTLVPQNFSRGPEKEHPCPKPVALWGWLLSMLGTAGQTVIDPFMGSGTTLRVAKNLGMNAIGIELEERYCEIAAMRLAQEVFAL